MPARAIKLLKDRRWRATPLYTVLSQAGKKTCLVSELLHRGAAAAAHTPRERGVGRDCKEGRGKSGRRAVRQSLEDIEGGRPQENKKSARIILSGHSNSSHISVISSPFDLVNA